MSNVVAMPDGYGGHIGERHEMVAKPGSHVAYSQGPELIVEWYDFGPHAPYESANLLIFDRPAQLKLMELVDLGAGLTPHILASRLANHFASYFEVKEFAQAHEIPFDAEVDFWP
jgi:hypothetical protein